MNFVFVALALLPLAFSKFEPWSDSDPNERLFQTTAKDDTVVCHDDSMSVYMSKTQFSNLPFTVYVQDELGGFYQATAVAKFCHYYFEETHSFFILKVSHQGCFVKGDGLTVSVRVVVVSPVEGSVPEIVHSVQLLCEKNDKESNTFPDAMKLHFCTKDGFNITIPSDATFPPLNTDAVWIAFDTNGWCEPYGRSRDAVTFIFSYADCGTRSKIEGGNITYWTIIEVRRHPQSEIILRHTPFRLTVQCSFTLTQMTQLGFDVQQSKTLYPSPLKNKGQLRLEIRFAKGSPDFLKCDLSYPYGKYLSQYSSYRSFHSSSDPRRVAELGQLVFVEVFLKHEDTDLHLLLDDCWATPTNDPYDPYSWTLLEKGCPFEGDSHGTVLLSVSRDEVKSPSLYKRFVVKLFSFVKPPTDENLVYFHCKVEVCKGPHCTHSCDKGNRNLRGISLSQRQNIFPTVVSGGPLSVV